MSDPINILWTSGWDSTFRVASLLLQEGRIVQPWYVRDRWRRSEKTEIRRMSEIRAALIQKDPSVRERLHPLIVINVDTIPPNDYITERFSNLRSKYFLGTQYEVLARLAYWKKIELELSVHLDDTVHVILEDAIELQNDGVYRIRKDVSDSREIFSQYSFPIFSLSKTDMEQAARENGFEDIMEMTWFCHYPLFDGSPCGQCNPCRYTAEEGMGRRVPPVTLIRKVQYLILRFSGIVRYRSFMNRQKLLRLIGGQIQRPSGSATGS